MRSSLSYTLYEPFEKDPAEYLKEVESKKILEDDLNVIDLTCETLVQFRIRLCVAEVHVLQAGKRHTRVNTLNCARVST